MLNQFSNLSCYEEFEIQCALAGISKIDALKEIGHKVGNYYFFISNDGIFNWFDLKGNHVKDPGILKEIEQEHIPENITKCVIPDSVTSIGEETFSCCDSLTSITIPNSVTSIGGGIFVGCNSLTSINIPNGVSNISNATFYGCESLKSISISDNVKHIGNAAFFACKSLISITIPDSISNIGNRAFYYCDSLTSITIPINVTNIGIETFDGCNSLKEVIFKGKTLAEVKQMKNYPFGIKNESIIKCELNDFSHHKGHKIYE